MQPAPAVVFLVTLHSHLCKTGVLSHAAGEFCPIGTQEDTPTSLSSCDIQAFSVTNPKAESTKRKHRGDQNPLTTTALLSGSCSGVHLCPGGSYCPTPAERKPCEPGRWCPEGSIKSQPCNITVSDTCCQARLPQLTLWLRAYNTGLRASKSWWFQPWHSHSGATCAQHPCGEAAGLVCTTCMCLWRHSSCVPNPAGCHACHPCVQGMLVWNPFRRAPGSTNLLLESLVKASASLDGNSCPLNAINPLEGCPAGYFCPTAGQRLPCPAGHFCPVGVRMDSPPQGGFGGLQEAAADTHCSPAMCTHD